MECLDWKEKISGYIDGEISPAEVREVEGHLHECGTCRTLERRMRVVGTGVERTEATVPSDFREKLFARLEAEELLPRRRSLFVFSLRWAAVPLAAAAAFGLFLLVSPEKSKDLVAPQQSMPSSGLSAEEREIVAYLDVLEDPAALDDQGDTDTIEMFAPSGSRRG
jgi:anti-sigma factor RsiW